MYESFSNRRKSRKSFTLTLPQNLANPVKTYRGITVVQHPIDPRRMALLKERYAELKKVPLLYCCNQDRTKGGGLAPWNAIAIWRWGGSLECYCYLRNVQDLADGKTPYEW